MIEPWIQELVGIKYVESGNTPQSGFNCTGLARYIHKVKFNRELPDDPVKWRRMCEYHKWPCNIQAYDLILTTDDTTAPARIDSVDELAQMTVKEVEKIHLAVACDGREMIHARNDAESVVIEPIARYGPVIRGIYRFK